MNIQPAIDLLTARRATNGYADMADMLEACGLAFEDGEELHRLLLARVDVAHERAIGINEPARYRRLRA